MIANNDLSDTEKGRQIVRNLKWLGKQNSWTDAELQEVMDEVEKLQDFEVALECMRALDVVLEKYEAKKLAEGIPGLSQKEKDEKILATLKTFRGITDFTDVRYLRVLQDYYKIKDLNTRLEFCCEKDRHYEEYKSKTTIRRHVDIQALRAVKDPNEVAATRAEHRKHCRLLLGLIMFSYSTISFLFICGLVESTLRLLVILLIVAVPLALAIFQVSLQSFAKLICSLSERERLLIHFNQYFMDLGVRYWLLLMIFVVGWPGGVMLARSQHARTAVMMKNKVAMEKQAEKDHETKEAAERFKLAREQEEKELRDQDE